MFPYHEQIDEFHSQKVVLPSDMSGRLVGHRTANEDRLIKRLPELKAGLRVSKSSFKSQGSFAMKTILQTKFADEEYDIDDGLVLWKDDLKNEDGDDMSPSEVKDLVREALKDNRFKKQPRIKLNCVRVFYADQDAEKHHIDFPVYRKESDDSSRELAAVDAWVASNPTRVNVWFEEQIQARNKAKSGSGTQLRVVIRLLKRFCRSRASWDMPNGMKLTMLGVECHNYRKTVDDAFRTMLSTLKTRLGDNLEVENLADEASPKAKLTKTANDANMIELRDKTSEAIDKLAVLDDDKCTKTDARGAWDWVFKTDGFFKSYDDDNDDDDDDQKSSGGSGLAAAVPTNAVEPHGGNRFG